MLSLIMISVFIISATIFIFLRALSFIIDETDEINKKRYEAYDKQAERIEKEYENKERLYRIMKMDAEWISWNYGEAKMYKHGEKQNYNLVKVNTIEQQ